MKPDPWRAAVRDGRETEPKRISDESSFTRVATSGR